VSRDPVTEAAPQVVALHLRELPSTAVEALIDLVVAAGPEALMLAINAEFASRHTQSLRP